MDSIFLVESKVGVWVRIICVHVGGGCVLAYMLCTCYHTCAEHACACVIACVHLSDVFYACMLQRARCMPHTLYSIGDDDACHVSLNRTVAGDACA